MENKDSITAEGTAAVRETEDRAPKNDGETYTGGTGTAALTYGTVPPEPPPVIFSGGVDVFAIGSRIGSEGQYVITGKAGSGGGGDVYRAVKLRVGSELAIKKIRRGAFGTVDGRKEVDILKNLNHPCLPRIHDFLEIDGETYTVMDFVPGESLDKVVGREGPVPQEKAQEWALQLAGVLSYLHGQEPPVITATQSPPT